jgi:hypothetical protein
MKEEQLLVLNFWLHTVHRYSMVKLIPLISLDIICVGHFGGLKQYFDSVWKVLILCEWCRIGELFESMIILVVYYKYFDLVIFF